MTAFANLDELVNRFSGGNSGLPQQLWMRKDARVAGANAAAQIAGFSSSLWEYEGNPSHGAVPPTTAAPPDNTTQGSWMHTAPTGGRQLWLTGVGGLASVAGTLVLYDRLLHISGLSGIVTTAQTVGGSLTRNTGGLGNFIAAEIYTAIGSTQTTITASYTDQAGNSGQTTPTALFGGTNRNNAQRWLDLPLAAGDNGVRAVASVTLAATTGTAGNFGIVVGRKLFALTIVSGGISDVRSFMNGPMHDIGSACLAWYWEAATTTSPACDMWMQAAER